MFKKIITDKIHHHNINKEIYDEEHIREIRIFGILIHRRTFNMKNTFETKNNNEIGFKNKETE